MAKATAHALEGQASLRRDLLRWYGKKARDLPWRRGKDPYAIWVSEIMLQQTRVEVATPYFLRWMERFPTVQALAAADLEHVLQAWAGLGYYSRARNLHAAAKLAAVQGMPGSAEGLRQLPGVGAYTSGAIASIAFGERVPAVDGNVVRVLARINGWPGAASSPLLKARVGKAAAALVPAEAPGDWNQALMDLGATVCTPRKPRCDECPVVAHCVAHARESQETIPAPKKQPAVRVERRAYAVVENRGRVLLVRNPARGLLAGLWSLPGGPSERPLADLVLEQSGLVVRPTAVAASARHQFSHRTWEMSVHRADLVLGSARDPIAGSPHAQAESAWVAVGELDGHALPAAMRTALAVAGIGDRIGVAGIGIAGIEVVGIGAGAGASVGAGVGAGARPPTGRKPKRRQGSGPA